MATCAWRVNITLPSISAHVRSTATHSSNTPIGEGFGNRKICGSLQDLGIHVQGVTLATIFKLLCVSPQQAQSFVCHMACPTLAWLTRSFEAHFLHLSDNRQNINNQRQLHNRVYYQLSDSVCANRSFVPPLTAGALAYNLGSMAGPSRLQRAWKMQPWRIQKHRQKATCPQMMRPSTRLLCSECWQRDRVQILSRLHHSDLFLLRRAATAVAQT